MQQKTQTQAKILTHSSFKGGAGKSTLNYLTGVFLSQYGKKVLFIDLDPNCCLSQIVKKIFCDETAKDLISGLNPTPYNIAPNLDIIPGTLDMCFLQNIMDTALKNAIHKNRLSEKYDWIILDPPGSWNSHTRNAIFAADKLIIPGTISSLDFVATKKYFEQLENCCINADVYIVCNKSNKKLNEPNILEKYQEEFADFLCPQIIPDILSLKKLTSNPNYTLTPNVKKRLAQYVEYITGENMEVENA